MSGPLGILGGTCLLLKGAGWREFLRCRCCNVFNKGRLEAQWLVGSERGDVERASCFSFSIAAFCPLPFLPGGPSTGIHGGAPWLDYSTDDTIFMNQNIA